MIQDNQSKKKLRKNILEINRDKIIEKTQKGQIKAFYLPTYVSMSVQNFKSLKIEQLVSQVYITLQFMVLTTNLDQGLVNDIVQKFLIKCKHEGSVALSKTKNSKLDIKIQRQKIDRGRQVLIIKVNRFFTFEIEPYIFFTPFELIDLILSFQIQAVKSKSVQIRFSLMCPLDDDLENQHIQNKINYNSNGLFGQYDLAEGKLVVEYTRNHECLRLTDLNKYMCKIHMQEKTLTTVREADQFCHFHVPLYRFPMVPLLTIFLPMLLFAIINLAIFYQSDSLKNRIGNLATLIIAFVQIVSVVRQSIPPTPKVTMVQILVYCLLLSNLLCLIEGIIRYHSGAQQIVFFYLSLTISIIVFICPLFMVIFHYCYLMKSYNRDVKEYKFNASEVVNTWTKRSLQQYFDQFQIRQILDYALEMNINKQSKSKDKDFFEQSQKSNELQVRSGRKKYGLLKGKNNHK